MISALNLLEPKMKATNACLVLLVVSLGGCAAHKIPGTEIDDNDDTRMILGVIEQYRKAVESKNAQSIVELADENFKDDGGSAAPDDDLDYKSLYTVLPARLAKIDDIRLELAVRKIEINKELGDARATYTYSTSFKLPGLTPKPQSEAEIKQMTFHLADKDKHLWKITSGI
jgi:hypothetical protein